MTTEPLQASQSSAVDELREALRHAAARDIHERGQATGPTARASEPFEPRAIDRASVTAELERLGSRIDTVIERIDGITRASRRCSDV